MGNRALTIHISMFLITVLTTLLISGCSNENPVELEAKASITESKQFSDFFFERGSDSDSSYMAFRGINVENDSFKIEETSWVIYETGPLLQRSDFTRGILYYPMAMCGTVFNRTYLKLTFTEWISPAELDTIDWIKLIMYPDTISIVKTSTP